MLLLAVDTSGKQGSLALVRSDAGRCELLDLAPLTGGAFSAQLIPEIARSLQRCGLAKHDLDAFAVVTGPGSFTGLRVGLAAIKGLAEILRKPIAPVSLLEAVALAAGAPGQVVAALDAGRSQAYVGITQIRKGDVALKEALLLDRGGLLDLVQRSAPASVTTPDAALLDWLRDAAVSLCRVERPQADAIARLGFARVLAGDVVSPEQLEASYLRRSDAEIFASDGGRSAGPASGR